MENASKALIIAGAILLSILIITLGIMIYRQASGVIDSNAMDEFAVSSFNQKFTQYAGENIRGSNVNALFNAVVQNNLANEGDESKQITIVFNNKEIKNPTSTSETGKALTGKSYSVNTESDPKSGYVFKITVEQK